jgi:hypothetical protein
MHGVGDQRGNIVRHDFQRALSDHVLHFRNHLRAVERFAKEAAVGGLVGVGQFQLTGDQDDLDQRPALVNRIGELEPIDAARHLDVGKQQFDVGSGFEDRQRIVGIGCFNGVKAGVLDDIHRAHAQQHLVFDDEDGGRGVRRTQSHDARRFHLEPMN